MMNYSSNILKDEYPFILPHVIDRVRQRNVYIIDLYDKMKMLGLRMFDSIYLVRFIIEKKLGTPLGVFRQIDDIISRSEHFEEIPRSGEFDMSSEKIQTSHENELVNNIIGGLLKVVAEAPGRSFIKLKEEKKQLTKDTIEKLMESHFEISKDYILIKEILSNEMLLYNGSVDNVKSCLQKELDVFRQQKLYNVMTKMCYLNHVCDKLFTSMFQLSLTNLLQKLYRLFRDIDQLLKELVANMGDRTWKASLEKLQESYKNWKIKPDHDMLQKFPRAREFDFDSQLPLMNEFIRPFQRVMDRLFAKDKMDRKAPVEKGIILKDYEDSAAMMEGLPKKIDYEFVKDMVVQEKKKNYIMLNQIGNKTSKSEVKREQVLFDNASTHPTEDLYVGKKQACHKELRQIMSFGTTISTLYNCFEAKSREMKRVDMSIPSIVQSHIPSKINNSKVRNIMARIKSTTIEKNSRMHEGSTSLESDRVEGSSIHQMNRTPNRISLVERQRVNPKSADHSVISKSPNRVNLMKQKVLEALKSPESLENTTMKRTHGNTHRPNKSFQITRNPSRPTTRDVSSSKRSARSGLIMRQSKNGPLNWRDTQRSFYRPELEQSFYISKEDEERLDNNLDSFIHTPYIK